MRQVILAADFHTNNSIIYYNSNKHWMSGYFECCSLEHICFTININNQTSWSTIWMIVKIMWDKLWTFLFLIHLEWNFLEIIISCEVVVEERIRGYTWMICGVVYITCKMDAVTYNLPQQQQTIHFANR